MTLARVRDAAHGSGWDSDQGPSDAGDGHRQPGPPGRASDRDLHRRHWRPAVDQTRRHQVDLAPGAGSAACAASTSYTAIDQRAFSAAAQAARKPDGPLIAFMDDDIVLAGMAAIASLARRADELGPRLGWVAPLCVNAGERARLPAGSPALLAGRCLRPRTTSCAHPARVLQQQHRRARRRAAPRTSLGARVPDRAVPALGRVTEVQHETVSYHLDYGGSTRWDLMEEALAATTRREQRRLVAKTRPRPRRVAESAESSRREPLRRTARRAAVGRRAGPPRSRA